jgi:hypothetical protein
MIEAMKQALDALKLCNGAETADGIIIYTYKEITSLRQAIKTAEKQEPVAWMQADHEHISLWKDAYHTIPLYIAPLKREWVGLTAKDLSEIPPSAFEGAIWANAKLRELNGC